VTDKATLPPKHRGLGVAVRPDGAGGAEGSTNVIIALVASEIQPAALEIKNSEYVPAVKPPRKIEPVPLETTLTDWLVPFFLKVTVYPVLGVNPVMVIDPVGVPQDVGLTPEKSDCEGVNGFSATTTATVAALDVHPFAAAVTFIVYVPTTVGSIVFTFVLDIANPATGADALQE
jgi:hypothetical protein